MGAALCGLAVSAVVRSGGTRAGPGGAEAGAGLAPLCVQWFDGYASRGPCLAGGPGPGVLGHVELLVQSGGELFVAEEAEQCEAKGSVFLSGMAGERRKPLELFCLE